MTDFCIGKCGMIEAIYCQNVSPHLSGGRGMEGRVDGIKIS